VKLKDLARRAVPPLLADLYHHVRHGRSISYDWEGVYDHYRDVPAAGAKFDGELWRSAMRSRAQALAKRFPADEPPPLSGDDSLLPIVAGIAAIPSRRVTILDFGGGLAVSYLPLRAALGAEVEIDYHIVEVKAVIAAREGIPEIAAVQFHTQAPTDLRPDIVHIASTLQYIEEYEALLESLAAMNPRFILFVNFSGRNGPRFATAQRTVRGSIVPYWFLNIDEILSILGRFDYELVFHSLSDRSYDQSNLPRTHRAERPSNMLYARRGPSSR